MLEERPPTFVFRLFENPSKLSMWLRSWATELDCSIVWIFYLPLMPLFCLIMLLLRRSADPEAGTKLFWIFRLLIDCPASLVKDICEFCVFSFSKPCNN